jgi:hypothetical protein
MKMVERDEGCPQDFNVGDRIIVFVPWPHKGTVTSIQPAITELHSSGTIIGRAAIYEITIDGCDLRYRTFRRSIMPLPILEQLAEI